MIRRKLKHECSLQLTALVEFNSVAHQSKLAHTNKICFMCRNVDELENQIQNVELKCSQNSRLNYFKRYRLLNVSHG